MGKQACRKVKVANWLVRAGLFLLFIGVGLSGPVKGVAAAPEGAPTLRIAVGVYRPPYVMPDQKSGLEIELLQRIFARIGQAVELVPLPNSRSVNALTHRQIDGVGVYTGPASADLYQSDVLVEFQNVALARAALKPQPDSLPALKGQRIVAFQDACRVLGVGFKKICQDSLRYQEVPDQKTHLRMLWNDRVDIVVGELRTLDFFQRQAEVQAQAGESAAQLVAYQVFAPSRYRSAFTDPALRDEFNRALRAMKADGSYQALLNRYWVRLPLVSVLPAKVNNKEQDVAPASDLALLPYSTPQS